MLPGVTDVTHANWFGGYYQDVRRSVRHLRGRSRRAGCGSTRKSSSCPTIRRRRCYADRTGAIVGLDTAKRFGFKVGQTSADPGNDLSAGPTVGPWEFTIDGIYDSTIKGADKTNLIFNYQFLRETIPAQSGFRDRYNWYVLSIDNPDKAPESRGTDRRHVRQLAVGDQDQY